MIEQARDRTSIEDTLIQELSEAAKRKAVVPGVFYFLVCLKIGFHATSPSFQFHIEGSPTSFSMIVG